MAACGWRPCDVERLTAERGRSGPRPDVAGRPRSASAIVGSLATWPDRAGICAAFRLHAVPRSCDALRNFYPQIQAAGGDVLLVTMNEPEKLATFKKQLQLPFTCLADPQQAAYRAYQCPRGSWWSVLGPAMWWRATWMLFKHGLGKPVGDVRQLPGSFVIDRQGTIRFVHRSQHSADWASPDELVRTLSAICVETQPLAAG